MNHGNRADKHLGEVDARSGLAADVGDEPRAVRSSRQDVVAQRAHELLGALRLRRAVREDLGDGDRARRTAHRRRDQDDAGRRRHGTEHTGHGRRGGGVGRLQHQGQRTVDPGPEAVGQPVVRLAGGGTGRIVPGVGHGQPHGHDGRGEGQQDRGPPTAATTGRRWTARAQRWAVVSLVRTPRRRRCTLRRSMRRPATPRRAGSSVTAAITATRTAVDVPSARPWRKLSRISSRPSSEIITVPPANTTARPAVPMASTVAAWGSRPRRRRGPVAGHDEQRVVDAHAEADHHRHLRGEVRRRHDGRPQTERGDGRRHAGQRGDDRQAHGHDRAEGDEQDHGRGEEPDHLTGRDLDLLEQVRRRTPPRRRPARGRPPSRPWPRPPSPGARRPRA